MKFPDKISSDDKLMAPQRLYNDVIDVLEEGVKWVASCIQSGERTVKVLRVSKSKGSFIGSVNTISFNSHNQCSNMYIIIIYGKRRKRKFHQSRRNSEKNPEWAQEDKYQQRTTSHKKLNKNIEQQHRPLQNLGELRCFRKVSSSCFFHNTCHVVHRQRHVYRIQWFPYKRF
jgi:hypothetical protein